MNVSTGTVFRRGAIECPIDLGRAKSFAIHLTELSVTTAIFAVPNFVLIVYNISQIRLANFKFPAYIVGTAQA